MLRRSMLKEVVPGGLFERGGQSFIERQLHAQAFMHRSREHMLKR